MKPEENKKQQELNDEQLDNVSGGGEFTGYDPSERPR
ncbi:bacteriocin [Xylanibacter ruminicola]|uniref:Bacteriocin-type signal sequence-containing protein n=1 Tax=Xylanibacter ruminicola TaxID=839 RepID=A0A1M6VA25_XYLRU|nr:bacteriocin [Xylanibacter ruminicola]SHK78204.1 bacteriocin-type signal sequence-containing protein [Xylanibacter ruminicola]